MELIAGSRIVKAQSRIVAARPYVEGLDRLAANLSNAPGASSHPLVGEPEPGTGAAVVAIAGDRGLSGPYNPSVLRRTETVVDEYTSAGRRPLLLGVGKRAQSYLRFQGRHVDESFTGMTDMPTWEDAEKIAAAVLSAYQDGRIASADIVSFRFRSVGYQRVEHRKLFPLEQAGGVPFDYESEPAVEDLITLLLPRLVEARVYLALLEAAASEHAARQRAMKAATDNADELVKNLRRVMNRVRQESITTEIMDIVGGAEALRHSAGRGLPSLRDAPDQGAA